jgi:hypothetical protein
MPGGILLFWPLGGGSAATPSTPVGTIFGVDMSFAVEFRVRFPGPTNETLPPSQLSGSILTLSSGSVDSAFWSLWYAKDALTSQTGTIYVTSSAGRLELTSVPIFDDRFYNISVRRDWFTGSFVLTAMRHESGEEVFSTSSYALLGQPGHPGHPSASNYSTIELGSSTKFPSRPEFWGQELRLWYTDITQQELESHSAHFENYGRDVTQRNDSLGFHWRMNEGGAADSSGKVFLVSSVSSVITGSDRIGSGSSFTANTSVYDKFLESYAYIPPLDYGWNQQKVRVFDGSKIETADAYYDEKFVSLEFNLYDALNEDISHMLASYDELNTVLGYPMNRYRCDYEGLQQMRETYFKRLQGQLNFSVFVDMLDFFDNSFVTIVQRLLPARAIFKGDEITVESHMLERPKYAYGFRPIREGILDISGSIAIIERDEDWR